MHMTTQDFATHLAAFPLLPMEVRDRAVSLAESMSEEDQMSFLDKLVTLHSKLEKENEQGETMITRQETLLDEMEKAMKKLDRTQTEENEQTSDVLAAVKDISNI